MAPRILPLALAAMLASCHQPSPTPRPAATPAAAPNGYAAKVAALPDRLRAGVLLRAIRDAGQDCQQVTAQKAAAGSNPAAWVATCDGQRQWVVAIADDGTAQVVDAKDLAAHGGGVTN